MINVTHNASSCRAVATSTNDSVSLLRLGGRVDLTCPSTPDQWLKFVNQICYCELQWQWDVFFWVLLLFSVGALIHSCRCLLLMVASSRDRRIKFNAKFLIIIMNIVALSVSVVYIVSFYDGRGYAQWFSEYFNWSDDTIRAFAVLQSFLEHFTVCLLVGEILLIFLVWKSVVEGSRHVAIVRSETTDKHNFLMTLLVVALQFAVVVPLGVFGDHGCDLCASASGFIELSLSIMFLFFASRYVITLKRLLVAGNGKHLEGVDHMLRSLYSILTAVVIILISVVCNVGLSPSRNGYYLVWGFWFPILVSQTFISIALARAVTFNLSRSSSPDNRRSSRPGNNSINGLTSKAPPANFDANLKKSAVLRAI